MMGPNWQPQQPPQPLGPAGPPVPDMEAPTSVWNPPNIGPVASKRNLDTKPTPVMSPSAEYQAGFEQATMAQSSPGLEDFGPLAQSLRNPTGSASTQAQHPWSAPTQQAPQPSHVPSVASSPSNPSMQGVSYNPSPAKQPLGIPPSQPNLPQAYTGSGSQPSLPQSYTGSGSQPSMPQAYTGSGSQPSLPQMGPMRPTPIGSSDDNEATIAGGESPLKMHPSYASMPATSMTLDETTSISESTATSAEMVAATPVVDKPTRPRPVRPTTPQPPIKAAPPLQSSSSPSLPSTDATAEMQEPPRAVPSFSNEVTEEKTAAGGALPHLPRPKLPENFVFAAKAEIPSFFARGVAGLIDMVILLAITYLITKWAGPKVAYTFPEGMHIVNMVTIGLQKYQTALLFGAQVFAGVYVAYATLMHGFLGKTIGKLVCSIKVVSHTGRPLGWFGSFARSIAFLLFTSLSLLGLFWILFDREYKALHDKVSGCIVVKDSPAYPLPK